jgi:hypothetical protein
MSASLVDVRTWMTRYGMSVIWAVGVLGNIINIYMFTRKGFLRNSCCVYLLAASTVNIFTISWGIFPSIYILTNVDPSTYSFVYCKLRLYTLHTLLMIGRSLTVWACFDRYAVCSGSVRLRVFCDPKMALKIVIGTLLIWPILTIHIPILQIFTGTSCITTGAYVLIYGLYSTIFAGILPPLLMTIFSILTIYHRRNLRARLNTTRANNKRDHTLVLMLSSEVIVYIVTTCLYPAITLYKAIINGQTQSTQSTQIINFVSFLGSSFLLYLNCASVFYVYFTVSKQFRTDFKLAITNIIRRITGRARVEPASTHINDTLHRDTHV